MLKDGVNDKKLVQVLAPAVRTSGAGGDIDHMNGGNLADKVTVVFDVGAEGITLSGTDYITFKLTKGDAATPTDPVTAEDIILPANAPAGVVFTPDGAGIMVKFDANAEIPGVFSIGVRHGKRYTRVASVHEGTHGVGTPYGVVAILEGLAFKPAE
jgi:hypothetical protein